MFHFSLAVYSLFFSFSLVLCSFILIYLSMILAYISCLGITEVLKSLNLCLYHILKNIHLLFLWNNIQFYRYATFSLLVHQLVSTWGSFFFPVFGYCEHPVQVFVWTCVISLDIHLGVGWLGHKVTVCSIFWDKLFFKRITLTYYHWQWTRVDEGRFRFVILLFDFHTYFIPFISITAAFCIN